MVVVAGEAESVLARFAVYVGVDRLTVAEGGAFAASGGGSGGEGEGKEEGGEKEEEAREAGVDGGHFLGMAEGGEMGSGVMGWDGRMVS